MKIGILFDLDGTLLDSLGDLHNSVNYIMRRYGLPERTVDEVRQFVGHGAMHLLRCAFDGRQEDVLEQALAQYQEHYKNHCRERTRLYDGIAQALEQIREHYPVAVVSNKPDRAVKALCGLYLPGVYALGETEGCPRKPAPDMLRKAMAELGVDRCVYVGDSDVDVQTAANVGMPCLSVLWGFRDEACIRQAGGQYFCSRPEDLPEKIQQVVSVAL